MYSFLGEDIEEEPQEELTAEQRQGQYYRTEYFVCKENHFVHLFVDPI